MGADATLAILKTLSDIDQYEANKRKELDQDSSTHFLRAYQWVTAAIVVPALIVGLLVYWFCGPTWLRWTVVGFYFVGTFMLTMNFEVSQTTIFVTGFSIVIFLGSTMTPSFVAGVRFPSSRCPILPGYFSEGLVLYALARPISVSCETGGWYLSAFPVSTLIGIALAQVVKQ